MKPQKLTSNQRTMLKRRGLSPENYLFLKSTYTSVYFLNVKTLQIKIIEKGARYNWLLSR